MLKIGLTGGIGSGKSFVAEILEKMNFPVYYSDPEAKRIMDKNPIIRKELIELLGNDIYLEEGLNRTLLAEKIFNDEELRQKVNTIVHPQVRLGFLDWIEKQNAQVVFNEAAIFFETGAYKGFDAMILVTAPENIRIQRVVERDNMSPELVRARMSKQWKDDQKIPLANCVIVNDGKRALLPQIESCLKDIVRDFS